MSFDLSFYKDQLLNKLGECKDRAAAALKALDNCEVNLKVTIINTKDNKMPYSKPYKIGEHSKSKSKHSCSRESERIYKTGGHRSYSPAWDDDSDSDCSCDECDPCDCAFCSGRGRSPYGVPIYVGGAGGPFQQNVNQQNINVVPGCHGKGGHRHGRRSRSRGRPVIVLPSRGHAPRYHLGLLPRHEDGHCCIHGYDPLTICPQDCHPHRQHQRLHHQNAVMTRGNYTPITNDDGKVDFYNNAKLFNKFKDFADAHTKAKKDKEDADKKKQDEAADLINKLLKPAASSSSSTWPGGYERSAEDIRSELERVDADMDQLRTWASVIAADTAAHNEAEVMTDQMAMCSGALQGEENKENVRRRKQKQLNSALAGPKKVNFADHFHCKTGNRVEEITDEDEEKHECDCC